MSDGRYREVSLICADFGLRVLERYRGISSFSQYFQTAVIEGIIGTGNFVEYILKYFLSSSILVMVK